MLIAIGRKMNVLLIFSPRGPQPVGEDRDTETQAPPWLAGTTMIHSRLLKSTWRNDVSVSRLV